MSSTDIRVIYDGGCPICRAFAHRLRLHDPAARLALVDARADPEQRRVLAAAGFDLEQGIAVIECDTCRTGADAAHALAKLHAGTGLTDRLAVWCFGTRGRAALLYPLFRACRRLLLFVLGRKPL
jgi:predicted DCC family thiol-disulfide oxidoreductase YuxK